MASPPSLFTVLRSPWIWGCFVVILALRCLYFDTFVLAPESAELLSWGQHVAQAPFLGLQQLLQDVAQQGPLHSEAYPLNKLHQVMALPIENALQITRLSALLVLMPGLTLGTHSLWAVQFVSAAWAVWVAFLAGVWALRLLAPKGYQARHERLSILLATLFVVAFNPLFLRYSLYPTDTLVALGFLLTALVLVGSRPAAAQWYFPQRIAVGVNLVLAFYAAPLWPMAFIGVWMLWDLVRHGNTGATWRFWISVLLGVSPALLWMARANLFSQSSLFEHLGGSVWGVLGTFLACSSVGFIGLGYSGYQWFTNRHAQASAHTSTPWWLGFIALVALAFVTEHSTFYLALIPGIPLGIAALWPHPLARKYVGTLALLGAFVISVFPVWIVHHGFPQEQLMTQQAQPRRMLTQWLKQQSLHNTTLFFSTPESARLFMPRLVSGSVLPHAADWARALKSGKAEAFREQHYPSTPVLTQKWLVVSEAEQTYLEDLRPFFALKPLQKSGPWQVFELGSRP